MTTETRLLIKNARLDHANGAAHDILIVGSTVAEIATAIDAPPGVSVENVQGALILPGLVDAHCHLDKTLLGQPWHSHVTGFSVADRVRIDHQLRRGLGMPSVKNSSALVEQMVSLGTTAVRTHTEIDSEVGLAGVEVIAEIAETYADVISIEQVAFPQSGILGEPGVDSLLHEAISLGARVVGGIDPAGAERDPVEHLNRVFGLAVATGVAIDIHLHDPGELGAWELDLICERARVEGLAGRVNISHAIALGQVSDRRQAQLIEMLSSSGVSVTTCIAHNDPPPPVKTLTDAGVLLTAGNDSIRNTWSPFGTGDMLERAWLLAVRTGLRSDSELGLALEIASINGQKLVGAAPSPTIGVGTIADFFAVDAMNVGDAIARRPPRIIVVKSGKVVSREPAV